MEMRGYFERLEPFVDLLMEGSPEPVKALVDTGFNADLMLPRQLVEDLGLPKVGRGFYVTASGDRPPERGSWSSHESAAHPRCPPPRC